MKTRLPEMCFGISVAFLLCATPAAAQETVDADAAKVGNDTPRAMTSTHTIGTHRFGAVVTVGWTRDLL